MELVGSYFYKKVFLVFKYSPLQHEKKHAYFCNGVLRAIGLWSMLVKKLQ